MELPLAAVPLSARDLAPLAGACLRPCALFCSPALLLTGLCGKRTFCWLGQSAQARVPTFSATTSAICTEWDSSGGGTGSSGSAGGASSFGSGWHGGPLGAGIYYRGFQIGRNKKKIRPRRAGGEGSPDGHASSPTHAASAHSPLPMATPATSFSQIQRPCPGGDPLPS